MEGPAGVEVATSAALRRGRTMVPGNSVANSAFPQVGPELAVPTGGKWLCAGGAFPLSVGRPGLPRLE